LRDGPFIIRVAEHFEVTAAAVTHFKRCTRAQVKARSGKAVRALSLSLVQRLRASHKCNPLWPHGHCACAFGYCVFFLPASDCRFRSEHSLPTRQALPSGEYRRSPFSPFFFGSLLAKAHPQTNVEMSCPFTGLTMGTPLFRRGWVWQPASSASRLYDRPSRSHGHFPFEPLPLSHSEALAPLIAVESAAGGG
jgi:hypothetical protein